MKFAKAFLLLLLTEGAGHSADMGAGFASLYTITDLGSVSGVPTPYSSLLFKSGSPNVLLLGGSAAGASGEIYAIPVTRSPKTNHITALGPAAPFASAPNIDGGLIYAPNGDLLYTTYSNNQIGQIKPGDSFPSKTVSSPTTASTGSFQIVPAGFPGAGMLVVDAVNSSQMCSVTLTPDGLGTYNVGNCSVTETGVKKTEGILYVPGGSPGFSGQMMLIAEFAGNQVSAFAVGPSGLPVVSSEQVFVTGIPGPQGAATDPLTGDFFFSTFSTTGVNEVYEVSLNSPGVAPAITGIVNAASSTSQLSPGLPAAIYGANFGSNSANVEVSVGNATAPVLLAAPTQLTVQIPFEVPAGATAATVTVNGTPSVAFPITLLATAPALETDAGLALVQTSSSNPVTLMAPAHPGDVLTAYATGLGPTTPATPTGVATNGAPVATLPTLTVGGVKATVNSAAIVAGQEGVYQAAFIVPPGVQGTTPMVLSSGGQDSAPANLPVAGVSAVVNNASFLQPGTIAPGSIASVFANGLGSASTNQVSGLFPSTQSENVQVTFNGEASSMFHLIPTASPQQIDLFIPTDLPTSGAVNVQLSTSTGSYPNYTLNMVPASPGFYRFTDPKTKSQFVIAQFANSAWLVLPASTTSNLGLPACASGTSAVTECGEPAAIGDYLALYLTGLGLATPNGDPNGKPLPAGQNPPADGSVLYQTPTLPTVTIGGVTTKVLFSGMAPGYAGEYQIDVQIPAGVAAGDNVPVAVTMMGANDTAFISVQSSRIKPPNQ